MLLNYLKLSLRLLIRNPFSSLINIAGLSIGLAVFIIVWSYTQFELGSDQFHQDHERIFRIGFSQKESTGENQFGVSNPEFIRRVAQDLPAVENYTRVLNQGNFFNGSLPHRNQIFIFYTDQKNQRTSFVEQKIAYADANVFDFFTIPLVHGNSKDVLKESNTVAISESTAKKYFGADEPVGKILYLNDTNPLVVTGVFEDLARNTHLTFDIVISMKTVEKYVSSLDSWAMTHGYYKLHQGISTIQFERDLNQYYQKTFNERFSANFGPAQYTFYVQPISSMLFHGLGWDRFQGRSYTLLSILSLVSVVILAMAWVNYINLTLSANQKRMKELAARKGVGATTRDFVLQFVIEALVINLIALLAAFTLVQLFRYPAREFGFYFPDGKNFTLALKLIIVITFSLGIALTGLYPALATLKRSPRVLFGNVGYKNGRFGIAHWLTVFQYGTSITLIIWAGTVYLQVNHILHFDLGINTEQVVTIDLPFQQDAEVKSQINNFDHRLATLSTISDYALSGTVIGDSNLGGIALKQNEKTERIWIVSNGGVDEKFIPFFGIKLIAGRNFLPKNRADENSIILSSSAARVLGLGNPQEALGKEILSIQAGPKKYLGARVIGVIDDYHVDPLFRESGAPAGLALTYKTYLDSGSLTWKASMRLSPANLELALQQIQTVYAESFPHTVFNWYFLNDNINRHYNGEKTTSNQIIFFTVVAIGIACLGLLGMISNKVVEKTKEIGIRKVMGAKMHHLGYVLLNNSFKQILLSAILGLPIAWYLSQQYLEKFSDRIALQWWHYALPVAILLVIMFCTIASILFKAAKANPVEALRYE